MKANFTRVLAVFLCTAMLLGGSALGSSAQASQTQAVGDTLMKGLYNGLNVVVEALVKGICTIYANPSSWQSIDEYDSDEVGFLPGRSTYRTQAGEGNEWSLGYSSRSILPEDVNSGKYNLGRDLTNKFAQGVYDDQRIRVAVLDDNSGEGAVVIGSIDSLGVTSTDTRTIRKAVLEYCAEKGIKVASINISATHAHSALDTQGVSTEFFRKLAGSFWQNIFGINGELPGLETAASFKQYFIAQSVQAIKEALVNMESGKMYFSAVDCNGMIKDKRDLIAKEDLPDMAVLCFEPANGNAPTYIADITCHATSFSAGNGLVGSDYIFYLDQYIKEANGGNFVMVPGALGQVSRDISYSTEGMDENELKGADAKYLGREFAKLILAADFSKELAPVLNVTHREIFVTPQNSILTLACEINLVNNKVYYEGTVFKKYMMATEMGYIELGNSVGFALFPAELYPEVFWDDEITGGANWNGEEWPYPSLHNSVDGVAVYPVSLTNDAIGYVLTDNNFAFMGHIIGDGIADEVLSVGGKMGSFLVEEYYAMINGMK